MSAPARRLTVTLFDLDHTLLTGDSDVLWCDFLIGRGLLDGDEFSARNADMDTRYRAGTVGVREFTEFYVGTLAGQTPEFWEPLRRDFLESEVVPRIPAAARQLVTQHVSSADCVVMTTATNRFITELTARHLNIEHLIASEPEIVDGRFTGRASGTLNMREGKVTRLTAWLQERFGLSLAQVESTAFSDSKNDLPLLQAVNHPVAVDPDPLLRDWAVANGHPVISLRPAPSESTWT